MKILLFLSAIISGAIGLLIFVNAQGGIHEATGAAILVISAVSFGSAGIVEALNRIENKLDLMKPPPQPE